MKNIILLIFTVFIFSACSNKDLNLSHDLQKQEGIFSNKLGKEIDISELVKQLEHYPIIFVGDHHNTEKTHQFFTKLLKQMDKKAYKLNLANEWFTKEHNTLLKDYTDGKIDSKQLKEKRQWDKFTKFKWDYLEPIYETVKKNGGKLYGVNLTKEQRTKISSSKTDEMTKEEKIFYDSLDLNVSAHQKLVMPYLNHCKKMPSKSEEPCEQRMYRVQVAWDSYMAKNIAELANEVLSSPKDKLIVFVGSMHIEYDLGIPLRFARLSNLPFVTISNEKISKEEDLKLEINKADFVYIYK